MQIIRKILLFNVIVVLLMHMIIHHKHHSELTNEEHNRIHSEAESWIDFVGLVFHQNSTKNFETIVFVDSIHVEEVKNPYQDYYNNNFVHKGLIDNRFSFYNIYSTSLYIKRDNLFFVVSRGPPMHDNFS